MYIIKNIEKLKRAYSELKTEEQRSNLALVLPIYNRLGGYIVNENNVKVMNWTEDKKIEAKDIALFEDVAKKVKKNDKKVSKEEINK